MSILSFEFLAFVAALAVLYYVLPLRARKWALLAGSAVFWLLGGVFGTACLLAETALIYGAARVIGNKAASLRSRRVVLTAVLLTVFAGLCLLRELLPAGSALNLESAQWLRLAVPLGISYFTFQSVGYLIDVYRGKAAAEKNYLKLLLFCGFFPQLSQGPIGAWRELEPQLDSPHRLNPQTFDEAVYLMAWGFFKKLVIADRIAPFVQEMLAHSAELSGFAALLTVIAYTLQLYTDFSGGVDIVRGASKLFGIELAVNFKQPFFAVSVADYWRRWHISLGTWFRTYLLYPLATSRFSVKLAALGTKLFGKKAGGGLPSAVSVFIVFVLIGLWHTFRWNALLYGAWFGLLSMLAILLEPCFKALKKRLGITKKTRWFRALGLLRTWLAVLFAQFFACTASPAEAFSLIGRVATGFGAPPLASLGFITFDAAECVVCGIALIMLFIVDLLCERRKDLLARVSGSRLYIRWTLLMLLMLAVLVFGKYGVGSDASAFVYAGF